MESIVSYHPVSGRGFDWQRCGCCGVCGNAAVLSILYGGGNPIHNN